jgi:heterotetrameric sarcosine oxidase gamma subunit
VTGEALLDDSISATRFAAEAGDGDLPGRVRAVVIGGGMAGSSAAYHLAGLGLSDVLVLERKRIASGTSWHAAGLLARVRGSHPMTELAGYGVDTYARLEAETGVPIGYHCSGSLTLARTPGRMDEIAYTAAMARHHEAQANIIPPEAVGELWPLASTEGVLGGLHQPGDASVNPGWAALAFAKGAHDRGVMFREGVRVGRILTSGDAVVGVQTERGIVDCEIVVACCGLWTRDLAASVGASVPLYAAEHVHVTTGPIDGAVASLPILRDLDGYLYIRHYRGRLLVGAFEPNGKPRSTESVGRDFAFGEFDPDWDHFAPVRRNAEQRVPALRSAVWERFLCAPESFTPDANFCLGETPEVRGLYVSAGFNSQGIIYGPGAGRALAEWIVEGAPSFDASEVDVGRFARSQSNRRYLHERTREGLGRLYALHWPFLQPSTARGVRRTPLYERLAQANACFGEAAEWERANWFAPAGGDPVYEYSFGRQNWFDAAGEEHRAAREAVALFDLSSFAKLEVVGPAALGVLQRVCTANVDAEVGRIVYTLMLNSRGGIELDGTVTRLAEDRFLVVTPTVTQRAAYHRLRRVAAEAPRAASVFDATSSWATLAVMGPRSRELLNRISPDDLSNAAHPWGRAREIEVADAFALALRISFVGELGWELYVPSEFAVNVYDAIVTAGAGLGLRHAGYHALDSLRAEKGYRHLGHDIGPADDPFQAALEFTVAMDKDGGFVGRDALLHKASHPPSRRQVFVKLDDPDPLLYHGESILLEGRGVGKVSSGAYGHTLGAAVGLGFVNREALEAVDRAPDGFEIDVAGTLVPAALSDTPLYDPGNDRLRA